MATANGDFIVFGESSTCANDGTNWTGDVDWFQLTYGCTDPATVTLSWTEIDTDMDLVVGDPTTGNVLASAYTVGFTSPEQVSVTIAGSIDVGVLCWEGASNNAWVLDVTF